MPNAIGASGNPFRGTTASRAANINVDINRIRKYNTGRKDYIKYTCWILVFALLFIGLAVFLFYSQWTVSGVICAIVGVSLALLAKFVFPTINPEFFQSGLLNPGIVVNTNPLTVVVLSDISCPGDDTAYEEDDEEEDTDTCIRWGCKVIKPGNGDWHLLTGDRVPCSTLFAFPDGAKQVFKTFNVYPLIWATANKNDLNKCIDAIDEQEWDFLKKIAPYAAEAIKDESNYLIQEEPEKYQRYKFIDLWESDPERKAEY